MLHAVGMFLMLLGGLTALLGLFGIVVHVAEERGIFIAAFSFVFSAIAILYALVHLKRTEMRVALGMCAAGSLLVSAGKWMI